MSSYSNSTIRDNNWMYMGLFEWTISRSSSGTTHAYIVNDSGYVYNYIVRIGNFAVRPCFYLTSDVTYVSGDGSINLPIKVN